MRKLALILLVAAGLALGLAGCDDEQAFYEDIFGSPVATPTPQRVEITLPVWRCDWLRCRWE